MVALAVSLVLTGVAACASGSDDAASDSTSPPTSTPTVETTLTGVATTISATTTVAGASSDTSAAIPVPTEPPPLSVETAVPATEPPVPVDGAAPVLALRGDGLGPFDFGSPAGPVIAAVSAQLGDISEEGSATFADTGRDDGLLESDEFLAFQYPFGHYMCWNVFCVQLAGPSADSEALVGWYQSGSAPATFLSTASGVMPGSRWSDFPAINGFAECYTDGAGEVDGVRLKLDAGPGFQWLLVNDAGDITPQLPNPADTTVSYMEAGEMPFQPEADC